MSARASHAALDLAAELQRWKGLVPAAARPVWRGHVETVSGVLGSEIDTVQTSIQTTLSATADLRAKLEAALKEATAASNIAASTELIVAAYAKFATSMHDLAPDLTGMTSAEAKRVTDELTLAESMLCLP